MNDVDYVKYFKNMPGFKRFILELKKKYEKSGKYTGFIKLSNITEVEKRDLEKFFGESYEVGSTVRLPIKTFEKVMSKTRFDDFNTADLVLSYYELDELLTNREKKKIKDEAYVDYLNDLLDKIKSKKFKIYLSEIVQSNTNTSRILSRRYNQNKNELYDTILKIDKLFCNIPNTPVSIPLFASMTGNPHFLDFNTSTGNLFMRFLSEINCTRVETIEEKLLLLENINVYNDTISNQTLTCNLLGNEMLENFNTFGPVSLNMDNISHLDEIRGINGKIFIFENPSILNYFKTKNLSIVITSGIPNLSFYKLLEKIEKTTTIYYNGDFDPEGLLIATKIKKVFPQLKLFCYDIDDYIATKPNESINKSRLHKLENVTDRDLIRIKEQIQKTGLVGYQENNLKRIEIYIDKEM